MSETIVRSVPNFAPNFTHVVNLKFVPLIVTSVPTGPLLGEKLLIVGLSGFSTVKLPLLLTL